MSSAPTPGKNDVRREGRANSLGAQASLPAGFPAVTDWLIAWSDGDEAALDQLIPLVHEELRQLAKGYMRRERGQRAARTLQTTALVNEAYLRLIDARRVQWQNRAH